jgi:hypothetical protein
MCINLFTYVINTSGLVFHNVRNEEILNTYYLRKPSFRFPAEIQFSAGIQGKGSALEASESETAAVVAERPPKGDIVEGLQYDVNTPH